MDDPGGFLFVKNLRASIVIKVGDEKSFLGGENNEVVNSYIK